MANNTYTSNWATVYDDGISPDGRNYIVGARDAESDAVVKAEIPIKMAHAYGLNSANPFGDNEAGFESIILRGTGNEKLRNFVMEIVNNQGAAKFEDQGGWFKERLGFGVLPGYVGYPVPTGLGMQTAGLAGDLATLVGTGLGFAVKAGGEALKKGAQLVGRQPIQLDGVYPELMATIEKFTEFTSKGGQQALREKIQNALNVDVTPNARSSFARIMDTALEFAMGGPESKLIVESAGGINSLVRAARELAEKTPVENVTREMAENLVDRAVRYYRTPQAQSGEMLYGGGMGITYGGISESLPVDHPLKEVIAFTGSVVAPGMAGKLFRYLSDTIVPLGALKRNLYDPIFVPGTTAAQAAQHAFAEMDTIFGQANTRRNRYRAAARVQELFAAAHAGGRQYLEGAENILLETPQLARAEARGINQTREMLEAQLDNLRWDRTNKPESMTKAEFEERQSNLLDNIDTAKQDYEILSTYGSYMEELYRQVLYTRDSGQAAAQLDRDVDRIIAINENFFESVYKVFNDSVDDTLFGGKSASDATSEQLSLPIGAINPQELIRRDYKKFKDDPQNYVPEFEETRKRLAKESLQEGQSINELNFVDKKTAASLGAKLGVERQGALEESLNESLYELLAAAKSSQQHAQQNIKQWVLQMGHGSVAEARAADPKFSKFVDDYIRNIYENYVDHWKALEEAMYIRVPGYADKMPEGAVLTYPEGTKFKGPDYEVDIGDLSVNEGIAKAIAEFDSAKKADPGDYFPNVLFEIVGLESARKAAKTIEQRQIAQSPGYGGSARDSKIEAAENKQTAAESDLTKAINKLDTQVASDTDKLNRLQDEFDQWLAEGPTVLEGRIFGEGGPRAANLLRYIATDPDVAWKELTKAKGKNIRKDWVDRIPDRLAQDLGFPMRSGGGHFPGEAIPDSRTAQVLDLTAENRATLIEIMGPQEAQRILDGEISLRDSMIPSLRELEADPSKMKYVAKAQQINYLDTLIQKNVDIDSLDIEINPEKYKTLKQAITTKQDAVATANANVEQVVKSVLRIAKEKEGELDILWKRMDDVRTPKDVDDIISKLKAEQRIKGAEWTPQRKTGQGALIDVLESLLTAENFPSLGVGELSTARATTRSRDRVQESGEPIRTADPDVLVEKLLRPKASTGHAKEAIRKAHEALAYVPEEIATITKNADGKFVADIKHELPFDESTKHLFDAESHPFTLDSSTGNIALKPNFRPGANFKQNQKAASVIELALMSELNNVFPDVNFGRERTTWAMGRGGKDELPDILEKFKNDFREPISFLRKYGAPEQTFFINSLDGDLEDVSKVLDALNQEKWLTFERQISNLQARNLLPKELNKKSFSAARRTVTNVVPEIKSLKDLVGADPGAWTNKFLDDVLSSPTYKTDVDNVLQALRNDPQALRGFKAALMNSVWERIQNPVAVPGVSLTPGAAQRLGKAPTVASADKLLSLINMNEFKQLIRKTYADAPEHGEAVLESLKFFGEGLGDVHAGRVSEIGGLGGEFMQRELWTNFGRAAGLASAKATGFINELYAAGAGGRIFREIGRKVTGNTIKDMIILQARDPKVAMQFLGDTAGLLKPSPGEGKIPGFISDFLGMLYLMGKQDLLPSAIIRKLGKGGATAAEIVTEGTEDRQEREDFFRWYKQSGTPTAEAPREASPVQVASAPRARPNTASVLNKSLFDYASPALSNNKASAQTDPATLAEGQKLFGATDPVFANKGGIVSLRKKPRQMVL